MVVTILLLIGSFAAKALMDISAKDAFGSSWLNKNMSWRFKYDKQMIPDYKHWYYPWKVSLKERFIFSTTMLVAFTDGWHLFQFVFLKCIMLALAVNMPYIFVYNFMIVNFVYAIIFNTIYSIFSKK